MTSDVRPQTRSLPSRDAKSSSQSFSSARERLESRREELRGTIEAYRTRRLSGTPRDTPVTAARSASKSQPDFEQKGSSRRSIADRVQQRGTGSIVVESTIEPMKPSGAQVVPPRQSVLASPSTLDKNEPPAVSSGVQNPVASQIPFSGAGGKTLRRGTSPPAVSAIESAGSDGSRPMELAPQSAKPATRKDANQITRTLVQPRLSQPPPSVSDSRPGSGTGMEPETPSAPDNAVASQVRSSGQDAGQVGGVNAAVLPPKTGFGGSILDRLRERGRRPNSSQAPTRSQKDGTTLNLPAIVQPANADVNSVVSSRESASPADPSLRAKSTTPEMPEQQNAAELPAKKTHGEINRSRTVETSTDGSGKSEINKSTGTEDLESVVGTPVPQGPAPSERRQDSRGTTGGDPALSRGANESVSGDAASNRAAATDREARRSERETSRERLESLRANFKDRRKVETREDAPGTDPEASANAGDNGSEHGGPDAVAEEHGVDEHPHDAPKKEGNRRPEEDTDAGNRGPRKLPGNHLDHDHFDPGDRVLTGRLSNLRLQHGHNHAERIDRVALRQELPAISRRSPAVIDHDHHYRLQQSLRQHIRYHDHCNWWLHLLTNWHLNHNHGWRDYCHTPGYWECWTPCHYRIITSPQPDARLRIVWYLGLEGVLIPDMQAMGIQEVTIGSPAEAAGLQPGDLIISVNGIAIETEQDFRNQIALSNGKLTLEIYRDGMEGSQIVEVQLKRLMQLRY